MAMDNPNQTFNDALTALNAAKDKQTVAQTKSNSTVAAIGAVIAAILAGVAQWVAAGGGLPEWAPIAILVVTLIGQVFGVSRTKNYITPNVIEQAKSELADRVDEFHEHTADAASTPAVSSYADRGDILAAELAAQVVRDAQGR